MNNISTQINLPLPEALKQWAENEMGFKGYHDWNSICKGQLSDKWRHIISHVRSESLVRVIKGNIILANNNTLLSTKKMNEQIKELQFSNEMKRKGISEMESHLKIAKKNIGNQSLTMRDLEREINDTSLIKNSILTHFVKTQDEKKIQYTQFLNQIQKSSGDLFRQKTNTRISTNGADSDSQRIVERMIEESISDFKEYTQYNTESSPGQNLSKSVYSCDLETLLKSTLDSETLLSALTNKVSLSNKEFQFPDLLSDSRKLKRECMQNGKAVNGSFIPIQKIIFDLCELHVSFVKGTIQNMESIKNTEHQIENDIQTLKRDLLVKKKLSEWDSDCIVRKVILEIQAERARVVYSFLKNAVFKMQAELNDNYSRSQNNNKSQFYNSEIDTLRSYIIDLRSKSKQFPERINKIKCSIAQLINSTFNERHYEEIFENIQKWKKLPTQILQKFQALPLRNYFVSSSGKNGSMKPLNDLSIYRFKRSNSELLDIVSLTTFSGVISWIHGILETKRNNKRKEILVKNYEDVSFQFDLIEKLLQRCSERENNQKNLLPQLESEIDSVDKSILDLKTIREALRAWKCEYGQETIDHDEEFLYKGLTLKKWKEQFYFALTKMTSSSNGG